MAHREDQQEETLMIGHLNHVAVAVHNVRETARVYRDLLGARISAPQELPEHGVTAIFIELDNTKIELLEPLGQDSPISQFLQKRGSGVHHICLEVASIADAAEKLQQQGCRLLGADTPQIGAHGKPVLFLHPSTFDGTLIELEEA